MVPLVEGIDALQFEFGIDTNGDGNPDAYTADPDSYGGCTGAACQQNWINVMAIKIHLLARGRTTSPGYVDTKTYSLGFNRSDEHTSELQSLMRISYAVFCLK